MPTTGRTRRAGLLQSTEEWSARNEALLQSLTALLNTYATFRSGRGLDIGCQEGVLTDGLSDNTGYPWWGIDPGIKEPRMSSGGANLLPGYAHDLPFEDEFFDCLVFANVFEHLLPEYRRSSMAEMFRVLRPGGVIVGQLPNPWFPIESHSRLPFMGWLPTALQRRYMRLSPVSWDHDFYVVTIRHVVREAAAVGFEVTHRENFNYPPAVIPKSIRPVAVLLEKPMKLYPWAWQFVLSRPERD